MPDYIFSARNIVDDSFGNNTDSQLHYLIVPDDEDTISPAHEVSQKQWLLSLIVRTEHLPMPEDILIYIHGYNTNEGDVLTRHRIIVDGLSKQQYNGKVVSFDWPCGNQSILYLPDRHKAKNTAMQLVNGGIALLASQQQNNCTINVHVLAHSTGAYVVREAFDDADDTNKVQTQDDDFGSVNLNAANWMVTQMIFVEGDISSNSMGEGSSDCQSVFKHVIRLTNYSNPYDNVLSLSNVKRAGFANRVGRVGLPIDAPANCINVNCGNYFIAIPDNPIKTQMGISYSHSWYFDPENNSAFMQDLNDTISGNIDRNYIPTRRLINGELFLVSKEAIKQQ